MQKLPYVQCSPQYCPYGWFCCAEYHIYGDMDRYPCEHWEKDTHQCKIYETRPQGCREAQCFERVVGINKRVDE